MVHATRLEYETAIKCEMVWSLGIAALYLHFKLSLLAMNILCYGIRNPFSIYANILNEYSLYLNMFIAIYFDAKCSMYFIFV